MKTIRAAIIMSLLATAGCTSADNITKTSALGVEYSKKAPKEVIVSNTYEVTSEVKSKHDIPNITIEEFAPKKGE